MEKIHLLNIKDYGVYYWMGPCYGSSLGTETLRFNPPYLHHHPGDMHKLLQLHTCNFIHLHSIMYQNVLLLIYM